MEIKFKRGYYNEMEKNKRGKEYNVKGEAKPMYIMTIQEDYFTGDKQEALRQAVSDLREKANELEEIYNKNEKALESWDSIEK